VVVGVCAIELQIPASASLKDKRSVLRAITARVRNQFNVSIAEVDHLDSWQLATIGLACVSTDAGYAHGLLEHVIKFIEHARPDLVLLDYEIELI
jgi:uncharacterized protein